MRMRFVVFGLLVALSTSGWAQNEMRVDITSFEDDMPWAYTGPVLDSLVETLPSPEGVSQLDGENALFTQYDTGDNGWQWAQLNFQNGAIDLSNMLELHMWVYFVDGAAGDLSFQVQLSQTDGTLFNLGTQTAPSTGQWHELVFPIDRLASPQIDDVGWFGGFISPGNTQASGVVFIDNIFAVRPEGVPILEDVLLYDFEEADPETGFPIGWGATWETDIAPSVGTGEVPASSGDSYLEATLVDGWRFAAQTTDALDKFDRWLDVKEIIIDVRLQSDFAGSWMQSTIVIQSGANDANDENLPDFETWDQYAEQGYADATSDWKTLIYAVDMSKHVTAMEQDNPWLQVFFVVNHGAEPMGQKVFLDNFRVAVEQGASSVNEWSLY